MALWGGWIGLYEKVSSLSWELIEVTQFLWQWICFFIMFTLSTTFINQTIYSFQLNWIVDLIPKEVYKKTLIELVSVLRHQTIIAKLQTISVE